MDQRLSLTTLGVEDLARARRFFEQGLGWRRAAVESDEVAFYQCGSLALALFARGDLARDAGLEDDGRGFVPVSIAWNGPSEDAVDDAFAVALAGGAEPIKTPQKTLWGGYSSYVRIPGSQHLLEIAFNPGFALSADGAVILPGTDVA